MIPPAAPAPHLHPHPAPLPVRSTIPSLGWGWLLALSPAALCLWLPAFAFTWFFSPTDGVSGPTTWWIALTTASVGATLAMTWFGFRGDRALLAGHGAAPSRWWLPLLLCLWPVAVPAYLVRRVVRHGSGLSSLAGWWAAWTTVILLMAVSAFGGWILASGWTADELERELAWRLEEESALDVQPGEWIVVSCPDENWYRVESTVTCLATAGEEGHLVDVELVDYYEFEWRPRTTI